MSAVVLSHACGTFGRRVSVTMVLLLLSVVIAPRVFAAEGVKPAIRFEKILWLWSDRPVGSLRPSASRPREVSTLSLPPQARLKGRLWASATLAKVGPSVEGILIRYSVSAQVVPLAGKGKPSWAVPFVLEESRIPKMVAGKSYQVSLETTPALSNYLNRLYLAGYWVNALSLQAEIEPHRGDAGPLSSTKSVLDVKP